MEFYDKILVERFKTGTLWFVWFCIEEMANYIWKLKWFIPIVVEDLYLDAEFVLFTSDWKGHHNGGIQCPLNLLFIPYEALVLVSIYYQIFRMLLSCIINNISVSWLEGLRWYCTMKGDVEKKRNGVAWEHGTVSRVWRPQGLWPYRHYSVPKEYSVYIMRALYNAKSL